MDVPKRCRCFLVSRPLGADNNDSLPPDWTAIGKEKPVPCLLENPPMIAHWAVCLLPWNTPVDVDASSKSAREWFEKATYLELGVEKQIPSGCRIPMSESASPVGLPRWKKTMVMRITSVYEIGWTFQDEDWLCDRNRELLAKWGVYRPVIWNCQEFAILMAQMAVHTLHSASTLRQLWIKRRNSVARTRFRRHGGLGIGMVVTFLVPGIGPALSLGCWLGAAGYMVTDGLKDENIGDKLNELVARYPEIGPLFWH